MKLAILTTLASVLIYSCVTPKSINYSFNSRSVNDSVVQLLKKREKFHHAPYQQIKWFALLKENDGVFELTLNEQFGDRTYPFNRLIKKTTRFLLIDSLRIPVLFESDILSYEMRKEKIGTIYWGGYYFKIGKEDYEYKVVETAVLF